MPSRDFRKHARRLSSDQRSTSSRSRKAASRFLARNPRGSARSTAYRKTAGEGTCHSPRRIACGLLMRRKRCQMVEFVGPGLGGGYGHLLLRADLIPFRAPVLVPPVRNKPDADEKSAQNVHCGASSCSPWLLVVYAPSTPESNAAWQITTNHCEERHRSFASTISTVERHQHYEMLD